MTLTILDPATGRPVALTLPDPDAEEPPDACRETPCLAPPDGTRHEPRREAEPSA